MNVINLSAVCLVLLILLFIYIGWWFKRAVTTSSDFLLAGRSAPFWLLATSYLGGFIGGASVAGYMGYGYSKGIPSMWVSIWVVTGVVLFVCLFAKRLNHFGRKYDAVTISDFVCARYGESMRIPAAFASIFRPLFITALQILAIALALDVAFGIPTIIGAFIAAIAILLYMITGGQYSAIINQWLQSIIQSLAILLVAVFAFKAAGDISSVTKSFYSVLPKYMIDFWSTDLNIFSVWFISFGLFYLIDPWIYMWAYIGKNPRVSSTAQLATLGCSYYNVLPFIAGMAVLAAVVRGIYALPEDITPDKIYVWFAINKMGLLAGCIVMVGLFMTILSCGSSFCMNGVTIFTRDIYQRVINKNATNEQSIRAGRISLIILVGLAVSSALWLPILVPLWIIGQAICVSGLLCPVLAAWFWKRSTKSGAVASCLGGTFGAIAWAMFCWIKVGSPGALFHGIHAVHVGLALSIILMVVVSLVTKPDEQHLIDMTNYGRLGDDMQLNPLVKDEDCGSGLFGWLGARTIPIKIAWILCLGIFVLHYLLSFGYQYLPLGLLMSWISFITGVVMIFVFLISGGKDVIDLVNNLKK